MTPLRTIGRALRVLVVRPDLWPTAIRQARLFAPDRWWSRRPFLPLPDREVLAFRATTQYGDPGHGVEGADLIAWLEWCRAEALR